MEFNFSNLRALAGDKAIADVPCPACLDQCRTPEGRKRKCLRIYDEHKDFIRFTCARCQTSGYAKPDDGSVKGPVTKPEKTPEQKKDKADLCRFLWDKSQPAIGSPVQTYLTRRSCWNGPRTTVRYMPATDKYPVTMISRFGFEGDTLTGLHLTKLKPDGSGKFEGEGPAKTTMGDTVGQPIVLNVNDDREELVVAEGIEDTESLILATGWTGWAAGTAGRIPHVITTAVNKGFTKIYVARDVDWINQHARGGTIEAGASKHALIQAASITPIIPLSFGGKVAGMDQHLDANAALQKYGKDWLMHAIEWCAIHQRKDGLWENGLLSLHQFIKRRDELKPVLFPGT